MDTFQYKKLLKDNITMEYKRSKSTILNSTNTEAAKIARNLDLEDRIDEFVQAPAYITVKDHKPGFPNKVQCRLINPARSNIGCKSKQILEKIVREIKSATAYNQWQSSTVVIQWFKTLENKHQLLFFKFDVVPVTRALVMNL